MSVVERPPAGGPPVNPDPGSGGAAIFALLVACLTWVWTYDGDLAVFVGGVVLMLLTSRNRDGGGIS